MRARLVSVAHMKPLVASRAVLRMRRKPHMTLSHLFPTLLRSFPRSIQARRAITIALLRGGAYVSPKHLVRDILADIGWAAWLSMFAIERYALSTMIVKICASICFLCSSLILFPEVNWPCVLMQLIMLTINARRTYFLLGSPPAAAADTNEPARIEVVDHHTPEDSKS